MTLASVTRLRARELGAIVALFLVTLPAVTPRLYSSDEVQYYSYLRSLWFDRDVSFDNEYRYFYEHGVPRTPLFEQTFLVPLTPTGLRESFATIGCAILWAPFYAVADAVTRARRALGAEVAADGYSAPYIAAVAYGSAIYGLLALVLAIGAARRLTGNGVLAGLAAWFGTPLLFYMYAAPPFSHACSAFAVALFVTVWLRVRERWSARGAIALGAAAALMTMVREQDVFYALGPAADFIVAFVTSRRPPLRPGSAAPARSGVPTDARAWLVAAAAGVGAFVICYLPQLLAYLTLNGRLGPSRLVTRKMTWYSPHAPGVLASPEHGLFAWTPLAILAVAGLILLALRSPSPAPDADAIAERAPSDDPGRPRFDRRVGGCLLLMFALQVYVNGSVESWTVAGAFGQRRFVGATILLVIGLAALWRAVPRGWWRAAVATCAVLAIWWNVGLMALFGAGLMDRQRLTLRQNAYDVFITLPRMAPELAYRYFVQRESFYQKGRQQ
ncbi:MAG: hypothetical protein ACRD1U_00630 [Vicinamibacterales bacterium]